MIGYYKIIVFAFVCRYVKLKLYCCLVTIFVSIGCFPSTCRNRFDKRLIIFINREVDLYYLFFTIIFPTRIVDPLNIGNFDFCFFDLNIDSIGFNGLFIISVSESNLAPIIIVFIYVSNSVGRFVRRTILLFNKNRSVTDTLIPTIKDFNIVTRICYVCGKFVSALFITTGNLGNSIVFILDPSFKITNRRKYNVLCGHLSMYDTILVHPCCYGIVICKTLNFSAYGKEALYLSVAVNVSYLIYIEELNSNVSRYGKCSTVHSVQNEHIEFFFYPSNFFVICIIEVIVCHACCLSNESEQEFFGNRYVTYCIEYAVALVEVRKSLVHSLGAELVGIFCCGCNVIHSSVVVLTKLLCVLIYLGIYLLVCKIFNFIVKIELLRELDYEILIKSISTNLVRKVEYLHVIDLLENGYDFVYGKIVGYERNHLICIAIKGSEYLLLDRLGNHIALDCLEKDSSELIGNLEGYSNLTAISKLGKININMLCYDLHNRFDLRNLVLITGNAERNGNLKITNNSEINAQFVRKKRLIILYVVVCKNSGSRNLLERRNNS